MIASDSLSMILLTDYHCCSSAMSVSTNHEYVCYVQAVLVLVLDGALFVWEQAKFFLAKGS